MYQTNYARRERKLEPGGGPRITETAGYIPAKAQIEQMILAGRRLNDARKEQFDFSGEEEVPDDFMVPTRAPGYDLADASADLEVVTGRLEAQAAAAREAAAAKEKARLKKAQEPPPLEEVLKEPAE